MRVTRSTFPQDVSVLLGLLVDGSPTTRIDHTRRPSILAEECHHLLGRSSEEAKFHMISEVQDCRPYRRTTRECGRGDTEKSSKGIHIALNWGFLMPDKRLSLVTLQFLQLLEDVDCSGAYNWGGVALGTLYRLLYRARSPRDKEIGGPLVVFQVSQHINSF
ncbi:hypothetical protein RHSIM_Rhsim12G0010900 [Rhododendron simsii]|uniref:Aminotransferase-like plant mobile domain-containing protein n=1 Tax=Rhododendron simsii TaxID=118357 RepID=A0A834G3T4_RHOSS|nr:hypothetical protein RHSIM_Rhsim12G0010900 [Rhododendron simsii]